MAKVKRSTSEENVSAAYDRLIAASNQVGQDTKTLFQRVTELEGEVETIHREAQEKLLEITKEYEAYKKKSKQEIMNLSNQVDGYASKFGAISKAIQEPLKTKSQYGNEGD